MADETRINDLLTQLNAEIGEYTPYKLAFVSPGEIQPVEKNAHFMPKRLFDQLVDNIKNDQNLSTLPFCWKKADGSFVVLSGNHRVQAAKEANIQKILVLYTDEDLTRSRQIAIQLSHNSLVGQDNPTLLLDLWNELDSLQAKIYTGLDDNLLQTLPPVNVIRLNEEPLRLEEPSILFVPAEIERVSDVIKRIGKSNRTRLIAGVDEFDRFFDKLLEFKEAEGIINTATAFAKMADILEEYLAQNEHHEVEHGQTS
ncbi:hypothetical protein ADN00_15765 [Ornatilinea apprima]|uniref:ParB-like N-terminal domain-containing protein n=1 Tax=Ornatilinea apprima TaxID=1134406 RepID=A0A0P6XAS0_9CHLR|nr:ParB N-terminal domain-containing protein [Ornatilinea apprima]KPL72271.1 hypothetical protein ADN00_15765 [Ornatilinea apprima]